MRRTHKHEVDTTVHPSNPAHSGVSLGSKEESNDAVGLVRSPEQTCADVRGAGGPRMLSQIVKTAPRRTHRRNPPLISCRVEPVIPNLSRYQ